MTGLKEIKKELYELRKMITSLSKSSTERIGSKEISKILNTTPSSLRVRLPLLIEKGYPIKKDGSKIVALRSELIEFDKNYIKNL